MRPIAYNQIFHLSNECFVSPLVLQNKSRESWEAESSGRIHTRAGTKLELLQVEVSEVLEPTAFRNNSHVQPSKVQGQVEVMGAAEYRHQPLV